MKPTPEIGDAVTYVDVRGQPRNALVTCIFSRGEEALPSINVVIVADDPAKDDPYGRQMERWTSIVHKDDQAAHGNYWE